MIHDTLYGHTSISIYQRPKVHEYLPVIIISQALVIGDATEYLKALDRILFQCVQLLNRERPITVPRQNPRYHVTYTSPKVVGSLILTSELENDSDRKSEQIALTSPTKPPEKMAFAWKASGLTCVVPVVFIPCSSRRLDNQCLCKNLY